MIIRKATLSDLDAISEVESCCFPEAEAASYSSIRKRLETFPDLFWLLMDGDTIVSVIDGMASNLHDLCDEMYADAKMHDPDGDWLMIFGVETVPAYRGRNCASTLMKRVIEDTKAAGRKGIVLTCKEALVPFYSSFGYLNEGLSESDHGGAAWYQMRLTYEGEKI